MSIIPHARAARSVGKPIKKSLLFNLGLNLSFQCVPREEPTACLGSSSSQHESVSVSDHSAMLDDGFTCSHGDYPCRFIERAVKSQRVIPHRVFAPVGLLQKAQVGTFHTSDNNTMVPCVLLVSQITVTIGRSVD